MNDRIVARGTEPVSLRSFHPNRAGHEAYATILEEFMHARASAGMALSDSGFPANPEASK